VRLLVVLAGLALCAGRTHASVAAEPIGALPPVAVPSVEHVTPVSELERLQFLGRAQPDVAIGELLKYADTLKREDPRHLETLMEIGAEYVAQSKGDDVEQLARRIEALSDRVALARPAAMLLRGHWLQGHGEVSKAERQFIEAAALVPADAPAYLRLRLLISYAEV